MKPIIPMKQYLIETDTKPGVKPRQMKGEIRMKWYAFIFKTDDGDMTKRYFLCESKNEAWGKAEDHAFTCGWKVYCMC